MSHYEPPVLLHNMSAPPRTAVETRLPLLCPYRRAALAPLFSLPHALVLSGHLQPGKEERWSVPDEWQANGGLADLRLCLLRDRIPSDAVTNRWPAPSDLLQALGLAVVPPVPGNVHFLIGHRLPYSNEQAADKQQVRGLPSPRPKPVYRIVPDPAFTIAILSRCCGAVLYGSRTPELNWDTLLGAAVVFDDPFLRSICFPKPTPSEP